MAVAEPKIITLQIDKVAAGVYRAEAQVHGGAVTEPSVHSSISEAIGETARAVPDGFAHFMEVRYCGLSSGTVGLLEAAQQSEEIASRLVALLAEMHAIAGS
ncbi:hypothetical protein [Hydrogenophaga pseudoflava]|uniref:hypothetical protein n=1 Tax=Hydrogenophaga pseudoflava TaxID=47421 RepID=UPI0008258339|nr:hypothetical protein [Hydrogenophaga pseudoflava]